MIRLCALLIVTLLVSSCRVETPHFGGDKERALAAAALAVDVSAVTRGLASGADPNKMVDVNGRWQSPWFLALYQLRPRQPAMVDIIKAMLKAGADPDKAWGTEGGDPKVAPESWWRKFMSSGARSGGAADRDTLWLVMMHPVPDAVRALLEAGFDPRLGNQSLVTAIESGQTEIVHLLVEAGVDVNGSTAAIPPLLAAIQTRNVALMTYLEEHGAREKP
jgi:Ankyrin repeats (3 copies)